MRRATPVLAHRLLWGVFIWAWLAPAEIQAQSFTVFPRIDCVEIHEEGLATAHLGYVNLSSSNVTIFRGTENYFAEEPQERDQPQVFEPGFHERAYSTTFDPAVGLRWIVRSQVAVVGADDAADFVCPEAEEPLAALALAVFGSGTLSSDAGDLSCPLGLCVELLPEGTVANLTATPASGFVFSGWGGDPECANGMVTLTRSHVCTATFHADEPIAALALAVFGNGSASSDAGNLSCPSGSCIALLPEGTIATLAAVPAPGYYFDGWGGDPECASGVVTLSEPRVCTATFLSEGGLLSVPAVGYRGLMSIALLFVALALRQLRR